MAKRSLHFCVIALLPCVIAFTGACTIIVDREPLQIAVPDDVFPADPHATVPPNTGGAPGTVSATPNMTRHPIFFIQDGLLVETVRELPAPVFLEGPLNDLLVGPTDLEAHQGLESAIPAGTSVVDVQLQRNNIISLHLNAVFFEVQGEQRIRATAQLVSTASRLADNTQGVRFYFNGHAQSLPDGSGTIELPVEGALPRALRSEDFTELLTNDSATLTDLPA